MARTAAPVLAALALLGPPPRFVGADQLWLSCQDNGFLALRFTNQAFRRQ